MKENEKELKQTILSLEEELRASMAREELLKEQMEMPKKESWIRGKINDPGSKFGKVVRLPRTVYRIVRYPEVRRELRGEAPLVSEKADENNENSRETIEDKELEPVPVKFFHSEDNTFRVNLIVREMQKDALKKAIEFANLNNCELRVVTYGEKSGVCKYRKFKKEKNFPIAEKISFYSSIEQDKRRNPFELEIGRNEMFLMDEWGNR